MKQYLQLLEQVMKSPLRSNRTGMAAHSLFGAQMRFDLRQGFPALTTKKLHLRSVVTELLWFLRGDTNIKYLHDNGCSIWNEWADENGDLGPMYGKQWRRWNGYHGAEIDQIQNALTLLRHNPQSRRILVSAWNPADLPDESKTPQQNVATGKMALAACHTLFQFYAENNRLSCQFYARSQDIFLGTPFNIASYALLTHIMAAAADLEVGELIWVGGDVHLYENHREQALRQLERQPRELPALRVTRQPTSPFEHRYDDFVFENYHPHPPICAEVAV